jgi:hypothetical protein
MTVQELIEKLQTLPQDLSVKQYTYDEYRSIMVEYEDVDEVKLSDDEKSVHIIY